VLAAFRDLVDAGLDQESLEAVAEAISEASHGPERNRCLALIRIAGGWIEAVAGGELPSRSGLLIEATNLVEAGVLPPTRGMLIYGFAEATGLVSDFLQGLVRRHGAEVLLDLPPNPSNSRERSAGSAFVERLADRLGGPGCLTTISWDAPSCSESPLEAFSAPGPEAEIREIAARIRTLLDEGVSPERIGVVSRLLDEGTAASIRRHFTRLGIPFSGEGATLPQGRSDRRLKALLELLSRRSRSSLSSWLELVDSLPGVEDLLLLEVGLRNAGVARLDDLDAMNLDYLRPKKRLELPLVTEVEDDGAEGRRVHASLPRAEVEAARSAASSLLETLAKRPEEAPFGDYLQWIREILDLIGISRDHHLSIRLEEPALKLQNLPPLRWDNLENLLPRILNDPSTETFGGEGGGVQILSVMEARSRCFEVLFLRALNRGSFPRQAHQDPIFPEHIRREVSVILPEIPLAERSHLEEKYLFAQLLAAAERVILSWQSVGADGKAVNPSAFIEKLRLEGRISKVPASVADVYSLKGCTLKPRRLRPAMEHAALSGLEGNRRELVMAAESLGISRAQHLKSVLDEMAPPFPREDLGPFLGLTGLGPPQKLWATRLESYAACPWQQFLRKVLGLAPPAETGYADNPLKGLLVGKVIHAVLEAILTQAGAPSGRARSLDEIRGLEAIRIHWPEEVRLRELLERTSRKVAEEEGLPILASPLARAVRPYLEEARKADWGAGFLDVLGAEVSGVCHLELDGEGKIDLHFRADRVDPAENGLLLTDYKSGKSAKNPETELKQGRRLQAAIYACSGDGDNEGRYLFLDPNSKKREQKLGAECSAELGRVIGILVAAWEEGLATPLWNDNDRCRNCEVREACFRDESGLGNRLMRVLEYLPEDHPLQALWKLPKTPANRGKA